MGKKTRKVELIREYADGTTETTIHPSRNAALGTVESYMADGILPAITGYGILPYRAEAK